jgi:NhaP-type Na+/H+ or K+/H+ antiporter
MLAILSLLVILSLSLLITRVATVALTYTGMSRESARFQARSAFTGTGFTTSESEKIVTHPVRRRIILLLMLFGNAGIVAVVTSLILTFVGEETGTRLTIKMPC